MSFEESVTRFYVALAEQQLEQVCQALGDMRVSAASSASSSDAAVRDEMLRSCEAKAQTLQDAALSGLQQACAGADVDVDAALSAFARCAALGAARAAAPRFGGCLSRIFAKQARASLERVRGSKQAAAVNEHGYIDRAFYVEALSELLTGASDIMNAVADVTADALVLRQVLEPIHAACADVALQMVEMYAGDARMVAWERRANAQAQRDPRQALQEEDVEADESLQMIDLFLDELAFIIRVLVSYTAFLATVCEGLGQEGEGGGFQVKVQELSGVYVVLERFYVFQSVHKATAIAEPQELEHGVYVSSVVEDASFVLNKAFFRASQCMNYHTALSIVIALVDALESQYLPAILALPSRPCAIPLSVPTAASAGSTANGSGSARLDGDGDGENEVSFSDMLLQAVDDDLERTLQEEARLIMAINSAFMSGEFVRALQEKIDEYSRSGFPSDAPILDCLPTPINDMTEAFHSIVSNEVQEVLSRSLRKRLLEVIQRQMEEQLKYVLTSSEYDALGSRGSPLLRLVEQEVLKNRELQRYERALCSAPFEDLVEAVTQDLTSCVERALLTTKKHCNDLGALQLEREVTDMLARVSTLVPQKSLRAAFTRLFQVVFILNLMQPSHVLDYLASVREELSLETIATLLRMRVDFKSQDVARAIDQMTKAEANNKASKAGGSS
ncbi:Golgi transport complex COD1 protein [Phytophthora cinnamomi]|uniref:Golgi transport complex COD1 protein n=1 Tax=Phytophthora cinnamomi TaxID=4785 RepID=UPI00355A51A5|nr:Golgi transport complex COD1 protein [Phytophthora cinnamomi]